MPTVPASRSTLWPRIVVLLCLAVVLALVGWIFSQVKKDHREEVARARSSLDRGQPDRAILAVSGIRDDGPGAAEGLTLAARALLMQGNISAARHALERSLKMKLAQPEAAKMLAAIYLAAGDGGRGLTLLKEAARLEPGDFRPWYAMGKVYHDLGNLDESIEAYTQALRRSPPAAETRETHLGRIRALLDAKQAERASSDLDELRRRTPDDPQVLALAARQARDLGRLDEAVELAGRALAGDPESFDALLVRARIHFVARRMKRAIADLEQAIRVKPNDVAALQLLAQAQKTLGLMREAAETQERAERSRARIALMDRLTKVIDERPLDPEPRWRMGQAAMDGEMYVLAYQSFQAALDLDPSFQPARRALETLRTKKGFDYTALAGAQLQITGKPAPPRP
jgi:tetratricopeptide (TPR) repeat protein